MRNKSQKCSRQGMLPAMAISAGMLCLAAGSLPAQMTPELMFKDTFNVPVASTDINENTAFRQSGSTGALTYTVNNQNNPDQVQLNAADAIGKLRLEAISNTAYVSPNRNFIDGGKFVIEFDMDAGINDPDHTSSDWCAIVFGATAQNAFVNASDGMGILFRSSGDIQVFNGSTAIYGGNGEFPGGIPKDQLHIRIEVDSPNFQGSSPATVKAFINGQQVRLGAEAGMEYIKQGGFKGNYITLEGYAADGSAWTYTFDNLSISAIPGITTTPVAVEKMKGQTSEPIQLSIPSQMNATAAAQVTITSLDPSVAIPTGAGADGKLTLEFAKGAATTQSFTVSALKAGRTTLVLSNTMGAGVNNSVVVNVSAGAGLAELLFQDNFNTSAGSYNINFENSKSRQSGVVGALDYSERSETVADGSLDYYTQVNNDQYPGKLLFTSTALAWASPKHNFTEAGQFTVEFKVTPGIGIPDRSSPDWGAVIIGASTPGTFVNASDGIGILFRNDGRIQVFDGGAAIYGSTTEELLPEGELSVKLDVATADFLGGSPATVTMTVNGSPVKISSQGDGLTYVKTAGFKNNYITLEGYGETSETSHAFDDLKISGLAGIRFLSSEVSTTAGLANQSVSVRIPEKMNATAAAVVSVISRNPSVAIPEGAVNGKLTLTYPVGSSAVQTVKVVGVGAGVTYFELDDNQGVATGSPLKVSVVESATSLVKDDFGKTAINAIWGRRDKGFEATGTAEIGIEAHDGVVEFAGTATGSYWAGTSLATEMAFSATTNAPVTFSIDRVAQVWSGSAVRSAVWITDASRSKFIFFSDNEGEGGWQYNRSIGETGDNATGTGINIAAFDGAAFDDGGKHQIKAVANGVTVQLFLDGVFGVEVPFPVSSGIVFEFGTYIRAQDDNVSVTYDNALITSALPASLPPITLTPATLSSRPGMTNGVVTVTVPKLMLTNESTVTLYSQNPSVAAPVGGTQGSLILRFAAGSSNVQTVNIAALGKGLTTLAASNSAGATVSGTVAVSVSSTLVANPGFENNYNTTWPGYSSIDSWTATGGSGVNQSGGPFHDNGTIPDRNRVALMQNANTLSQQINGLEAGKAYWLQFYYNARNGSATLDMSVRFDGAELAAFTDIRPVGASNPYHFASLPFTPQNDTGLLEFATTVTGDMTLLLDAVTIVRADANQTLVINPSFEAGGIPAFPGTVKPGLIAGWTTQGTGSYGYNFSGTGPFADNGLNPDQDTVLFMQENMAISQTISNLVAGKKYTLSYAYNARSGNTPHLKATLAGAVVQDSDVTPVGGSAPYRVKYYGFTAASSTAELVFAQTATGDNTVLLDNVVVREGEPPVSQDVALTIIRTGTTSVKISWPQTAGFVLQSAPGIAGPWTDSSIPSVIEGSNATVTDSVSGNRFYRLKKN